MSDRCALSQAQLTTFEDLLFAAAARRIPAGPELESERSKIYGMKIEKANVHHFSFSSSGSKFVIVNTVGTPDSKDPLAPLPVTRIVLFDGKDTFLVTSEGRSILKYSGLNLSICRLVPFVGVDYPSLQFLSPSKEARFFRAFPPPRDLVIASAASLSDGSAYSPRPSALKIVTVKGLPAVQTVYLGTPGHAYETYSQSNPIVLAGHVVYKHSKWTEFVVDSMLNDLFPRSIRETEVQDVSPRVGANVFNLSTYAKPGAEVDENPNTPEERRYLYGGERSQKERQSSYSARQSSAVAQTSPIVATLREARSKHKKVLLVFGASWCAGCIQLGKYLEALDVAPIITKHFIVQHISVSESSAKGHSNTPGGEELYRRLGLADSGLPSYAFLDDTGRVLATAKISNEDGSHSFLAFPVATGDIPLFLKLFKSADPTISIDELWKLRKALAR